MATRVKSLLLPRLLAKYRGRLVLILLALLAEMAFNSAVPLSLRFMIDDGLTPHNFQAVLLIITLLGAGALVVSAAGLGRDYLYASTHASMLADLRERMFAHLQNLSLGSHAKRDSGELLSRFSNDLSAVENAMCMAIPWGILPGLEAILSTVLLLVLDWRLGLVAIALWPWTLLAPRPFTRSATDASFVRKTKESHLLGRLAENLAAQPLVKAFNLHAIVGAKFRELNQTVAETSAIASFGSSLMERSTTTGILLIQVAVLGLSGYMAFHGLITLGILASFQGLLLILASSLLYIMQFGPSVVQASTAWSRIQSLLSESPDVIDHPASVPLGPFAQSIDFQNVSFSYDGSRLNLKGVHFQIPCGSNVAFVGASGSGKSTALSLLMRFYDPSQGSVCIDSTPLTGVTQQSLRRQMGIVFQESFLFNDSIKENIRIGKPNATRAEIETAANAAEIHDAIIAMPEQYDTVVGERGGKLSGGQRQRIAIARAIVGEPRILLLDEATSALDPATEALINHTLQKLSKGRTVIAVTHRLASITDADCIFVFALGCMVESGRHQDLLEKRGVYAQLWAKQAGFSFAADGSHVIVSPERLRAIPLLSDLELDLLEGIAHLCVTHSYRQNDEVFRQGDPGDKFHLIVRGRFQVVQDNRPVAILEDGDCFGEIALVTDRPRNATVRALTSSTCLALDRAHFQRLLRNSPVTQDRINRLVHSRLEVTSPAQFHP